MTTPAPTISTNGKRRTLSLMEQCFGAEAMKPGADAFSLELMPGVWALGKVSKISRRGRCAAVRVTLDFEESSAFAASDPGACGSD